MPRKPLAAFTDPARRPRTLIWAVVGVIGVAFVLIAALGATSSYWFCGGFCHSVQLDPVVAYDHSTHSRVACVSCHLPVNGDPVTFLYHKAHAGIVGAYQLVTKTYDTPLNPFSGLALNTEHMGSGQCTQCHSANRRITPHDGILIDHEAHESRGIQCTACHNRIAHPEDDIEITMVAPSSGTEAARHANFMTMTACFRCHTLGEKPPPGTEFKAPGTCSVCHPASFDLRPASHEATGFYPAGHARLAMMELDPVTGRPAESVTRPVLSGESTETSAPAGSGYEPGSADSHQIAVAPVSAVDYCGTCHKVDTFCVDCHGIEMPHPAGFVGNHAEEGKKNAESCSMCHGGGGKPIPGGGTDFCNNCHHSGADPKRSWLSQHMEKVDEAGAQACFRCHKPTFCAECHVRSGK